MVRAAPRIRTGWQRGWVIGSCLALVACASSPGVSSDLSTPTSSTRPSETAPTEHSTPSTPVEGLDPADAFAPTGDPQLDAALVSLFEFVADTRGLPFRESVAVEMLADDRFEAVVLAGMDERGSVVAMEQRRALLVAMGLWPADVSYSDVMRALMREGVVGLYVPSTGRLYVRGTSLTPLVRETVVHELTHALDDQWFGLDDDAANDDAAFAHGALAEGSSTWVEEQFIRQASAADRADADRQAAEEIAAMELPEFPLAVTEIGESVYSLGHTYVSRLIAKGGVEALDAAFASPPASTEMLLHPERAGAQLRPVDVATPDVPGVVVAAGVLGEQGIIELLNAALSPASAREAAEGWGGDAFVIVDVGNSRCAIVDIVTDSDDDQRQMYFAWTSWGTLQSDATVSDRPGGGVRVEACSPML